MRVEGVALVVPGDDVDTDVMYPGAYLNVEDPDQMAQYLFEGFDPTLRERLVDGTILVVGANFGIGSSREQAASVLVHLGLAAVIAPSYSGLYFRNAFNVGLLLLTAREADRIDDGEALSFDARAGVVTRADGRSLRCDPIPGFLLDMVDAGGLLPQLKRRLTNPTERS